MPGKAGQLDGSAEKPAGSAPPGDRRDRCSPRRRGSWSQLGGVPLFLYFWGISLYGEWLVLAAFPAWLVFSNLGFTHATLNEATMCVARGDLQAARGAFRTTWVFMTGVSFAIAAVLVSVAASAPLASWFGFSTLGDGDARIIVVLLLLQVLVHMQAELAAAGLFGAGRYGLHAFVGGSTRLAAFLLVALAVALGGGPLAAAAVMTGVECVGFVAMVSLARRHGPWMRHGVSGTSRSAFRRLASPSFGFAGFIAGNALAIQGSLLVIGAVLGPAAVAVFATLRLPARGLAILGNIGFAVLRPEITMAYGAGETARLRRLYARAMQFSLWLGVAGFIGLLFLGPPIVELWTGGRVVVEQPLFGWLLAGGMATLLWTGAATVLHATNRHARIAWLYVAVSGHRPRRVGIGCRSCRSERSGGGAGDLGVRGVRAGAEAGADVCRRALACAGHGRAETADGRSRAGLAQQVTESAEIRGSLRRWHVPAALPFLHRMRRREKTNRSTGSTIA